MILFLTHDLMIYSAAEADARRLGVMLKRVGDWESVIALIEQTEVTRVLVDLTTPGLSPDPCDEMWAARTPRPETIAFAPHVKEQLLSQSRLRFDRVLTRGQFHRKLSELLS